MAVVTVAFEDLDSWLQNQPENTVDTPYELEITGLTTSNCGRSVDEGQLGYILKQHRYKYVDLSETELPIKNSYNSIFNSCYNLVYPPIFPQAFPDPSSTNNNMQGVFYNCTSLKRTPRIPDYTKTMNNCFYNCTSLTEPPVIPDTVNNMYTTFYGCTFTKAPILPSSLEEMYGTFQECRYLTNPPIIPNGVRIMGASFKNCTRIAYKPVIPSSVTSSGNCFSGVTQTRIGVTHTDFDTTVTSQTTEFGIVEIEEDTANNCYEMTGRVAYGVDISNLSTWLQNADENTVDTPYEIKVLGMTTSDYGIGIRLANNPTKFVDLRYTELPSGITSLLALYQGCVSLVYAPQIPSGVTTLEYAFMQCSNLKQVPTIPNTVTLMTMAFADCQNITVAPTIPSGVTTMIRSFIRTGITATPSLPNTITSMEGMFIECTALTTITNIPTACEVMYEAFRGCTALTTIPAIPEGVENLYQAFEGCSNIVTVPLIPSTVDRANMCFKNCTSLRKINEFKIPLNTLKNNANFQNMFQGCSSLTEIGYVIKEDDWHVWRLKFGSNTVEGKIYSADGSYTTINEGTAVSITKSDLQLPILTDELWFPTESDSDIDATILKMLQYRYGVFKKETIPPDEKTMVLWADNADHFKTNLHIQPVDEVTVGNMQSVSSNAVAEKLSGLCFPIIPIITAFRTTASSSWQNVKYIGLNYKSAFDSLPTINGKTKKLRLVFEVLTQAQNGIYIGLQRQSDPSPIVKVDNLVVWGGASEGGFGVLVKIPVEPSILDPYTTIQFKSSIEGYAVSIGYVYAEVYYE